MGAGHASRRCRGWVAIEGVANTLMVCGTHGIALAPEITGAKYGPTGGTTRNILQEAAGGECGVADHLGGQALGRAAGEQQVLGIFLKEITSNFFESCR